MSLPIHWIVLLPSTPRDLAGVIGFVSHFQEKNEMCRSKTPEYVCYISKMAVILAFPYTPHTVEQNTSRAFCVSRDSFFSRCWDLTQPVAVKRHSSTPLKWGYTVSRISTHPFGKRLTPPRVSLSIYVSLKPPRKWHQSILNTTGCFSKFRCYITWIQSSASWEFYLGEFYLAWYSDCAGNLFSLWLTGVDSLSALQ